MAKALHHIVIVGSNVYAWQFALGLARRMPFNQLKIDVVENPSELQSETVICSSPTLRYFHRLLKIDEREFMRKCDARFHLADHYNTDEQLSFFLGYAEGRNTFQGVNLSHLLGRIIQEAPSLSKKYVDLTQYSLAASSEKAEKFSFSNNAEISEQLAYGYCFSSSKYLSYTKALALASGVNQIKADDWQWERETDLSDKLLLSNGASKSEIHADFFIDCASDAAQSSDFRLVHNIVSTESLVDLKEEVKSGARPDSGESKSTTYSYHGQNMTVCSYSRSLCYRREFFLGKESEQPSSSVEKNRELPLGNSSRDISTYPLGYVDKPWQKNRLMIGPAAATLGDFAVHTLQLVQSALLRFIDLFPNADSVRWCADEFNALSEQEYQRVLEFHMGQVFLPILKDESKCEELKLICPVLLNKVGIFRATGVFPPYEGESIGGDLWVSLFLAAGVVPDRIDPVVEQYSLREIEYFLEGQIESVAKLVAAMPDHEDYLARYLN